MGYDSVDKGNNGGNEYDAEWKTSLGCDGGRPSSFGFRRLLLLRCNNE